jgi:FkbM family methyltransferase
MEQMFKRFINYFVKKFIIFFRSILNKLGIRINFSTDGEDIILDKWLGGISNGFYIDIGSHNPIHVSNTYGFYLNGWSGICIDPNPGLKLKYSLFRSLDLFINSAIVLKKKSGSNLFYYYKNNTDLNTFSKKRVNIQRKLYGRYPTKKIKINILAIDDLIKLIANKELHFLNIDIEGLEYEIIKSLLNKKISPWCLAIEELGQTCENISRSKIKKFMNKKGYFLASRTFLTSIYIRKNILKKLPSKYVRALYL